MNSLTLEQLAHLEQQGWVRVQVPELWLALRAEAKTLQKNHQFEPSEIKTRVSTSQSQLIRNDLIHWVNLDTSIEAEKTFNQIMNLMMDQIKDYFRIALDHFEAHYAIYLQNHFYLRHSDQAIDNNKRHFSFAYYLNLNWKPAYGGELVGYRGLSPEKQFGIYPDGGTLVLFKSDIEHEVLMSHSERFSITGWMRTR